MAHLRRSQKAPMVVVDTGEEDSMETGRTGKRLVVQSAPLVRESDSQTSFQVPSFPDQSGSSQLLGNVFAPRFYGYQRQEVKTTDSALADKEVAVALLKGCSLPEDWKAIQARSAKEVLEVGAQGIAEISSAFINVFTRLVALTQERDRLLADKRLADENLGKIVIENGKLKEELEQCRAKNESDKYYYQSQMDESLKYWSHAYMKLETKYQRLRKKGSSRGRGN